LDTIPGTDDKKVKNFIKQDYSIDWVETAKIDKIENNKIIKNIYCRLSTNPTEEMYVFNTIP